MTLCRALVAVCCACLALAQARAQYLTTESGCLSCHKVPPPDNLFCRAVPVEVWAQTDKHSRAFHLLHETDPADPAKGDAKRTLVKQILGFDLAGAFDGPNYQRLKAGGDAETTRKVAVVKSCLRCHATWPIAADERYPTRPPAPLALGVSCQACHGPSARWDLPHREQVWRTVTPAGKAELGFTDVRTTAAKAGLCTSCHIGNLAEGKFVKHEWYAAGHPPLPSFELATFEAEMPMHWIPLAKKPKFEFRDDRPADEGALADQLDTLKRAGVPAAAIKPTYRAANFPDAAAKGLDPTRDLPQARSAVVAGAATLETYARLVGEYSRKSAAGEPGFAWPELALYDCAACHHRLRYDPALERRPMPRGVPGRPPLARWPQRGALLAAEQAAGYDAGQEADRWKTVRQPLAELEAAVLATPFGDPASMQMPAEALADALFQLAADASNTAFDAAAAHRAAYSLTDATHLETADYTSARQTAWLLRQLFAHQGNEDARRLFLDKGEDYLHLQLPSKQQGSVIGNLYRWLPAAAAYDPMRFRDELGVLRKSMPRDP
ncbi:MAG TPA: multiheme c-type cytochrome [Pirellulaceae bacterium]|nr:multiheme c-type cytochrome [Pirellulaceae bacterium]